jgi:hypothetical protein
MPSMVSYPRRLQSGHITCYLNRTYHVLTTGTAPGTCKTSGMHVNVRRLISLISLSESLSAKPKRCL